MISNKGRDNKRSKTVKMSKNMERLYKETKCREFSVLVKKMDFARILGKFTKVKIRYEVSSSPKTKNVTDTSPNNSRLKSNENGMVLLHRNAYNPHPVKENNSQTSSPRRANILRENNRLKKAPAIMKDQNCNYNKTSSNNNLKHYGIVFENPNSINNFDNKNKISLPELVPLIDDSILPSNQWSINYFPKNEEPKDDKVYDRIAAELEDLMYNEKPLKPEDKLNIENKHDDFPSIMDILNDNSSETLHKSNEQTESIEFKSSLESSDVEAMLLGKSNVADKEIEPTAMEVDSVTNLIDAVVPINPVTELEKSDPVLESIEDPQSPSILNESETKVVENDLNKLNEVIAPCEDLNQVSEMITNNTENEATKTNGVNDNTVKNEEVKVEESVKEETEFKITKKQFSPADIDSLTHVVFTKTVDGKSCKSVMCPRNLKYSIELEEKPVEFLGAPSFITSLEDLQVLLQIVDETELSSLYVLQ